VTVRESGSYRISFHVASATDTPKLHLECDDVDITDVLDVPNTAGYQNWTVIRKTVELTAGTHVFKLVIDGDSLNLDKMDFERGD